VKSFITLSTELTKLRCF